jgi:uncharacterized protein YjiS (DUF1127 family)
MTHILSKINSWLKREERARRTRVELNQLTDRDLADIGINRCDIHKISYEAVNVAI